MNYLLVDNLLNVTKFEISAIDTKLEAKFLAGRVAPIENLSTEWEFICENILSWVNYHFAPKKMTQSARAKWKRVCE